MLQLVDENTSDQYLPNAEGMLLIGSERHCECRYDTIPKIVAVLVGFQAHDWILYDMRSTAIQVNGATVSTGYALCDGDLLQIAQVRLRVVGMKPLRRDRVEHQKSAHCQAEFNAADGVTQHSKLSEICLIGTAQVCDVIFSPPSRLRTRHCLIVPYAQRWFVVNLTRGMAQHAGEKKWQSVAEIRDKDIVRLGHLTVSISIAIARQESETYSGVKNGDTDPIRSVVKAVLQGNEELYVADQVAKTGSDAVHPEFRGGGSTRGESPGGMATVSPHDELRKDDAGIPVDEELTAAAQTVFNTAKARQLMVARTTGRLQNITSGITLAGQLAQAEMDFVEGRRLLAFERMKALMRDNPWSRSLLMSFARMCDCVRLHTLCLNTLKLIQRQSPNDIVVLKSIARVSFLLASQEPQYFKLSIMYWKQVQNLCPQEHHEITTTIRNISAEQSIAYQFFEKV